MTASGIPSPRGRSVSAASLAYRALDLFAVVRRRRHQQKVPSEGREKLAKSASPHGDPSGNPAPGASALPVRSWSRAGPSAPPTGCSSSTAPARCPAKQAEIALLYVMRHSLAAVLVVANKTDLPPCLYIFMGFTPCTRYTQRRQKAPVCVNRGEVLWRRSCGERPVRL